MTALGDEKGESISSGVNANLLDPKKDVRTKKKPNNCCMSTLLICGTINIIIGVLTIRYDLLKVILEERIRMRPGLPPFDWWQSPPVDIKLSVFIYNVTNSELFMNGTDSKLKLEEVGPIVYYEKVTQEDVVFHEEDSTMSYSTVRNLRFSVEDSPPGILNKTVIMANPILLGAVGFIAESSVLKKIPFNLASKREKVFLEDNVYNALWNLSTPLLELAKTFLPFAVHRENAGILFNAYHSKHNRFTVKIGDKHGFKDFFKIVNHNGNKNIYQFTYERRKSCPIALEGSYDGSGYSPHLTRNTTLDLWIIGFCQTFKFTYEKDVELYGMNAYKYSIKEDMFDRFENISLDCHKGAGSNVLPNGMSDMSMCTFGTPTTISHPHFYGRSGIWENDVEGLHPNKEKHVSYTIIEPTIGSPLTQVGRLQANLAMPPLKGFNSEVEKLSGRIIPMFWAEYILEEIPEKIIISVYILSQILPVLQPIITVVCLISGFLCILAAILKLYNITLMEFFQCHSPKKFYIFTQTKHKLNEEKEDFLREKI